METPRIKIGLPGLKDIFSEGITPGSLVMISGPPGSGKTRLALQLLTEIRLANAQVNSKRSLFLTCDQNAATIRNQVRSLLKHAPAGEEACVPRVKFLHSFVLDARKDVNDVGIMQDQAIGSGNAGEKLVGVFAESDEGQRMTRRLAVRHLIRHICKIYLHPLNFKIKNNDLYLKAADSRPTRYGGVCLDGLQNLAEVRGVSPDERRDALHCISRALRALLVPRVGALKDQTLAILTVEESTISPETSQFEDYLADVVIKLSLETPFRGTRQRVLEVRKSRYDGAPLGDHLFRIVSPNDVLLRRRANELLGWDDDTLRDFRPGIVVYPRLKWQSTKIDNALSPLDAVGSHVRALQEALRDFQTVQQLLHDDNLYKAISKIVRGIRLSESDLSLIETLEKLLSEIIVQQYAAENSNLKEPMNALLSFLDRQKRFPPELMRFPSHLIQHARLA